MPFKVSSGFTLIEMTLVIFLMGLMVLLSTVNFKSDPMLVYGAMLQVKADLRQAQLMALTRGGRYGWRTLNATSYEIYQGTPGFRPIDPTTGKSFVVDLSKDFPNVNFQGNYQVEFGDGGVVFSGGGQNYILFHTVQTAVNRSFTVQAETGILK